MYFVAGLLVGVLLWLIPVMWPFIQNRSYALCKLALELHYAGEFVAAIHVCGRVLRSNPRNVLARELLHGYVERGISDDLLFQSHIRFVDQDPEDPRLHYDLGLLYAAKDNHLFARQEWEQVVKLDPGGGWGERAKDLLAAH